MIFIYFANYLYMMKITLLLMLLFFTFPSFASGTDLSQMTPKELLEFYKKNPDYWKKKLSIDYEKYKEGDYVVWRWELLNASGSWIPNQMVKFRISRIWKEYITTTNKNWIFNFEIKKSLFDDNNYLFTLSTDNNTIEATKYWKVIKDQSIYHFKIINTTPYKLEVIHNDFFLKTSFKLKEEIISTHSLLWIQGVPLFFLSFIILFLGWFLIFKDKFTASRTKKIKKTKKTISFDIPPQEEEMKEIQSPPKKIDFSSLK